MATTINAGTLYQEFNTYYQDMGQNLSSVFKAWEQGRTFPANATQVFHNGNLFVAANASFSSTLRPFKAAWNAVGGATFSPKEIPLRKRKVDVELYPDDISGTFLGFMETVGEADRSKWPFVRYVLEKLIAEKVAAEQEAADWAGTYNVNGTTHLAVTDGLKTIVTAGLSGSTMNEVTLTADATAAASAFDALEEFAASLPRFWRDKPIQILCSPEFELNYFRDRRNTHGSDTNYRGESRMMSVDGRPNWQLVPFDGIGMAGDTGWLIATPKANLLRIVRQGSYRVGMDTDARLVKVYADWEEGIGFAMDEMVYAHNPAASGS